MSNTRRLRQPRPRCADCRAAVRTSTDRGGRVVVRVEHAPSCPAWHGTTPNRVLAYARDQAAAGQRVLYVKTSGLASWPR